MKISEIKTYLMDAGWPQYNRVTNKAEKGGWSARNWLFVKVYTDEGLYGVGEASGWPRVVETAIRDEVGLGEDLMVDVHGPPWLSNEEMPPPEYKAGQIF